MISYSFEVELLRGELRGKNCVCVGFLSLFALDKYLFSLIFIIIWLGLNVSLFKLFKFNRRAKHYKGGVAKD